MRLVLVNPHTHTFGRSVSGALFRRKDFLKYDYFIKYFVKNKNREVVFFIDGMRTSFNGVGLSALFSLKIIAFTELFVWMLLNGINPLKIRVYFDVKRLDPKRDIFFDFSRSLVDIDDQSKLKLNQFEGVSIVHFTHYFKDVRKLSNYIRTLSSCIIVAENDLTENEYFRKFFPFVKNVYQLPFAFRARFISRTDYDARINKCLALGSITRIRNKEFLDFFRDAEGLHPMRKAIYGQVDAYKNEIDSLIKGFDDTTNVRKVNSNDSLASRLAKKYLPFFILEKLYPTAQINYFKFNIVDKFNNYKMFICPEESVGLPSINVFEGMACKCAYIGIEDPMYTNIGIIPEVHYIAYKKDDLEDFILKIRYYQSHPDELKKIAEKGYDFVKRNLGREKVAEVFWRDLEVISEEFSEYGRVVPICSFKKEL